MKDLRRLTSSYRRNIVWMLSVVDNIFVEANARLELVIQQIYFVEEPVRESVKIGVVIAESRLQNKLNFFQESRGANMFPNKQTVLEPVHFRVFRQALVETAHGGQKDDRIDVVEVRSPCGSLSPARIIRVR